MDRLYTKTKRLLDVVSKRPRWSSYWRKGCGCIRVGFQERTCHKCRAQRESKCSICYQDFVVITTFDERGVEILNFMMMCGARQRKTKLVACYVAFLCIMVNVFVIKAQVDALLSSVSNRGWFCPSYINIHLSLTKNQLMNSRVCFNSLSTSFQSECVYCNSRLYASTVSMKKETGLTICHTVRLT